MVQESLDNKKEIKPFKDSKEEADFLREKILENEKNFNLDKKEKEKENIEKIKEYQKRPSSEVLEEGIKISEGDKDSCLLDLESEEYNEKINAILDLIEEKGVHNALSLVDKMNDPHLEDDVHRFLVQWLKEGYEIKGLKEKTILWRSLKMTLFEISLPGTKEEKDVRSFKEMVSLMEQFYAGMFSVVGNSKKGGTSFTFEVATSENNSDIIIYTAVPDEKKVVFEKQVLSLFPNAQIIERKNDYNIFVDNGVVSGSVATLKRDSSLPLKVYEDFDHDPMNVIFNSFSKIAEKQEGVALQFVFGSGTEECSNRNRRILEELEKGLSMKEAVETVSWSLQSILKDLLKEFLGNKKNEEVNRKPDQVLIDAVKSKMAAVSVPVNIRIVSSARSFERSEAILDEIESSFSQFESSLGNSISFKRLKRKKLNKLSKDFIFRRFNKKNSIVLNTKELTSMMHISTTGNSPSPELKRANFKTASAPSDMDKRGILLGFNEHRNEKKEIFLSSEDRLRHFYVIGQTGTGKTNLLKSMIDQDIKNGEGVCMIDPHGSDVEDVLKRIPESRYDDLIYFEPGYTEMSLALNMLEYDKDRPEQKTFVVNELFSIFKKLYSNVPESMGPMFEQYFRNATMLVLEDPDSGSTLLDVSKVLSDKSFRDHKLSKSNNPVVNQFWKKIANKAGGESQLENIVPYITNKFDVFAANDIMRPIIAQQRSSFDFKEVMDQRKILLVNLSKGKLGDLNSHLLGLILVGKILMASLSREGSQDSPPFYLYIDEFQNVTTDSVNTILAEARKYKLSLNMAHQFISQLNESIRDSVFGNVGSIVSFRVGSDDAEFLSNRFQPEFSSKDLTNLYNFNAIGKILVNGYPSKPFNFKPLSSEGGDVNKVEELKHNSYKKYGRLRKEVEEEIREKYIDVI